MFSVEADVGVYSLLPQDTYFLGWVSENVFYASSRVFELNSANLDNLLRGTLEKREDFYGLDLVVESVGFSECLGNVRRGQFDRYSAHRK